MSESTIPATADRFDAHPEAASCALQFRSFGLRRRFAGRIRTVKSYQDNVLLKELPGTPPQGDGLVDAGVNCGGVDFVPGHWLCSDEEGILVAPTPLAP
jgi:regulator of RNase E activity RraA